MLQIGTYNHLNLPTTITLAGGPKQYDYDAAGVKQYQALQQTMQEDFSMKKLEPEILN